MDPVENDLKCSFAESSRRSKGSDLGNLGIWADKVGGESPPSGSSFGLMMRVTQSSLREVGLLCTHVLRLYTATWRGQERASG